VSDPKHWRTTLRDELHRASLRLLDFDEQSALLMVEASDALNVAHAVLDTFEAENQRLREALSDIAETETDWHYGIDENMQVVRNKAYIALQEGER
jgi:hypothetical protein